MKTEPFSPRQLNEALASAVRAARQTGELMRKNLRRVKKVNAEEQFDIKLELDVRCQRLIERTLSADFPNIPVLGEEGTTGDSATVRRWVIDPIDGTVNFAYGIPHACVSIALQEPLAEVETDSGRWRDHRSVVGVVYDPFCDELWTAVRGRPSLLNGRKIHVSARPKLSEAIVSVGFAKKTETMDRMLPVLNDLVPRVRKIRIMGAAALAMVYVASGRFDAYVEAGVRLWDIAAGGLILENSGGEFWHERISDDHTYAIIASNGLLRKSIERRPLFRSNSLRKL